MKEASCDRVQCFVSCFVCVRVFCGPWSPPTLSTSEREQRVTERGPVLCAVRCPVFCWVVAMLAYHFVWSLRCFVVIFCFKVQRDCRSSCALVRTATTHVVLRTCCMCRVFDQVWGLDGPDLANTSQDKVKIYVVSDMTQVLQRIRIATMQQRSSIMGVQQYGGLQ